MPPLFDQPFMTVERSCAGDWPGLFIICLLEIDFGILKIVIYPKYWVAGFVAVGELYEYLPPTLVTPANFCIAGQ